MHYEIPDTIIGDDETAFSECSVDVVLSHNQFDCWLIVVALLSSIVGGQEGGSGGRTPQPSHLQ